MFFNVQLQLKIPVLFSRILREDTDLTAARVGGCIWQMFCNRISLSHFSADTLLLHRDGAVSGRGEAIALQMSLLFWGNRWPL